MRKIKLDDREYEIKALPTKLLPYSVLYAKLMGELDKTASLEEAQKHSDLQKVTEEILNTCVKPSPEPHHEIQLVNIVIAYTGEQAEMGAKFFRPQQTSTGPTTPTEQSRTRP